MVGFKSVFLAYFEDISFAFLQQLNLYGTASWKTGALRKRFFIWYFHNADDQFAYFLVLKHTLPRAQVTPEKFVEKLVTQFYSVKF